MDILMLGGTRFFGKRIVELLLEGGHHVTLFTRGNSRPSFWDRVDHIIGDRSDHADFKAKLDGHSFEVVVDNYGYAASEVSTALECPAIRDSSHYIFTSSSVVYLSGSLTLPLQEKDVDFECSEQDLLPSRFHGGLREIAHTMGSYALEKLKSERLILQQQDLPFTIFRPPVVLGPGDHHQRGFFYIQRIRDGGPLLLANGGAQLVQNVYRDDIARAYLLAIQGEPTCRVFNIAGQLAPLWHWLELAAQELAQPAQFLAVGREALAQRLPGYHEPWEFDYNLFLDACRAERELGFQPTPLEEWWPETVRWYRDQRGLANSAGYEQRQQEIDFARGWRAALAGLDA
jgi:nucleoside-diphosphate-sugar epimerase